MSKKSIILLFLLAIVLYVFYSSNYLVVQKHEKHANEIAVLLSPKYFSNKLTGKQYPISQIIQINDPLYKPLKEKGIINDESYFSFKVLVVYRWLLENQKSYLGASHIF